MRGRNSIISSMTTSIPIRISVILIISVFLCLTLFISLRRESYHYYSQSSYLFYNPNSEVYSLSFIADMDTDSKTNTTWMSYIMKGTLRRTDNGHYKFEAGDEIALHGELNEGGRGMELSELVYFNNMLLACDDRTGIIYEIKNKHVYPRYILPQGNGDSVKGLKCEWMTVKDDKLYIGSIGKEWTTREGVFLHNDLKWVKVIDTNGVITSLNWESNYDKIKEVLGISGEGYVIHEAINWDSKSRMWLILPRRVSTELYNAKSEELMGSNKAIFFDETFSHWNVLELGSLISTRGFSSFKFVPYRHEEIVALKSVEHNGQIETYIVIFNVETGKTLLEETLISDKYKFEGIEFLH